jgi:predicted nucleotidyltransferase
MIPSGKNKIVSGFGLRDKDLQTVIAILQQHPDVEQALIFGSRAKGNYKPGSDVDIALKGATLDHKIVSHISSILNEETQMPYKFDVLNYDAISNKDLTEHIDRVGIVFYTK